MSGVCLLQLEIATGDYDWGLQLGITIGDYDSAIWLNDGPRSHRLAQIIPYALVNPHPIKMINSV